MTCPSPRAKGDAQYYERLGLGPAASHGDIVHAYRRLALALHPDARPGDPEASQRFREIAEAYEILTDPGRRLADEGTDRRRRIPVRQVGVVVGGKPRRGTAAPWRTGMGAPAVLLGSRGARRASDAALRAGPTRIERGTDVCIGLGPRSAPTDVVFALVDWCLRS